MASMNYFDFTGKYITYILSGTWKSVINNTGTCYDLFYPSTDNSKKHKGGMCYNTDQV
jgi:hypothetical protein